MRCVALLLVVSCSKPQQQETHSPSRDASVVPSIADASVVADAGVVKDAASRVAIVDAPMKWGARREELTLTYRRRHSDAEAKDLTIAPRVVLLHYTAGGSGKSTRAYMDNVEIEASRPALRKAGTVNVSSHYVVERDGTIYRIQPETRFARHCIGLNHIAIGIENVGDDKTWPLTDAQVEANAALVRDLAARFEITHVLGHYEAMKFRDHAYYVELDRTYMNDKPDPGPGFMAKVRAKIADLGLSGL